MSTTTSLYWHPPTVPVVLVRLRAGLVGESRRVVHLVELPTETDLPPTLTARCGHMFAPGQAERLVGITSMPCPHCLPPNPLPGPILPLIGPHRTRWQS